MFMIVGKMVINPDHREAFVNVFQDLSFTGTTSFTFAEDLHTPNTFHMYVQFPDRATADKVEHTEVPVFMGQIGRYLADTPKFTGYLIGETVVFME